jgi:hypothetical protein
MAARDDAPRLDPTEIERVCLDATRHNFGRTTYLTVPTAKGVLVELSSWPRQQEALAALREVGYRAAETTSALGLPALLVTDRHPAVVPAVRAAMVELADAVQDAAWSATAPSPELAGVRAAMVELRCHLRDSGDGRELAGRLHGQVERLRGVERDRSGGER